MWVAVWYVVQAFVCGAVCALGVCGMVCDLHFVYVWYGIWFVVCVCVVVSMLVCVWWYEGCRVCVVVCVGCGLFVV